MKAGHYSPVLWKRCKLLANYFLKRDLSKSTNTEYVFLKSNGDANIFEVYLPKYFTGQQLQALRRVCWYVAKCVHICVCVCVVSTRLVTQCFSLQDCAQHRSASGLSITLRTNAHFYTHNLVFMTSEDITLTYIHCLLSCLNLNHVYLT